MGRQFEMYGIKWDSIKSANGAKVQFVESKSQKSKGQVTSDTWCMFKCK